MSLYKKTTVNGWQPQQLTIRDAKFATWIAFFAWVFAVYDFILFGTLLPEIGDHFGWSEVEQAELATWVAVGGAIIALAIGPLVDKLGRRLGIVVTVGGAAVCSLLTAIGGAWGKGALIGIRSVAGLGYAEQTVNATYLTEIYAALDDPALNRRKGFIYSLVQGGWPVGALVASALTALLMPIIGWQGSFIFAALPSFIIALLALKLKETPQFQIHQHIHQLRHLGDIEQARQVARDYQVDYDAHQQAGLSAAFRGASLRATLVLGGAVLINWFAIQIFSVLGTTVLTKVHSVSFANSLLILVLSNLVGYCGYLTHGWLGDRFGRRNTIAVGWMIGGGVIRRDAFLPQQPPDDRRAVQHRFVLSDRPLCGGAVFHQRKLPYRHPRHGRRADRRDGADRRHYRRHRYHHRTQRRRPLANRRAVVRRRTLLRFRRHHAVRPPCGAAQRAL
ncbi:major facilitator superfamily protein, partial [Serratia marcescens subsp. marcescens Db11]